MDLNVISIIGIVLLIGIVKKNAIMMIDFALQAEREEGKGPADAIFEACMLRFRPILMTTMAALFGALPLALGTGTGSELRRPLGISIVGGLIVSQMLTLYTTPVALSRFRPHPAADEGQKTRCISPWREASSEQCVRTAIIGIARTDDALLANAPVRTLPCALLFPARLRAAWSARDTTARRHDRRAVPAALQGNPARFKGVGGWKVAQPSDAMLRGEWWKIFRTPS